MQDLVGTRVVDDCHRGRQDEIVAEVERCFDAAGCPIRIDDRRPRPSHGYRAVHLIIQIDDVPVELQVRTELQDEWAQTMEHVSAKWGRPIKYGGEPDPVEDTERGRARRDLVAWVRGLADRMDHHEQVRVKLEDIGRRVELLRDLGASENDEEILALLGDYERARKAHDHREKELREVLGKPLSWAQAM